MSFNKTNKKTEDNFSDPFVLQHGRFGANGRLEKYSHLREWIESSFSSSGLQGEVVGKTFEYGKLRIIGFFAFFFIALLVARSAWLQIYKADYYASQAEGNSVRSERIGAQRGIIYDRDQKPLVRNVADFMLSVVPADFPTLEEDRSKVLSVAAAMIFPDNATTAAAFVIESERKIGEIKWGSLESYRPLFLIDGIPYENAMRLYLSARDLGGLSVSAEGQREYLHGGVLSLSHILGYTGKVSPDDLEKFGDDYLPIDYIGKTGLESYWEKELKGTDGYKKYEVDALGNRKKIISDTPADDGHNLVLSLDWDLQKKAEEILKTNLAAMKLARGSAVVMNPKTGELLALVSLPAYDNQLFADGISTEQYLALSEDKTQPLFNRVISGEYPSGSTVKPMMAAAALQEKIVSEKTTVFSTGGLKVGIWFFPDWKAGGHGYTDVRKALADSVNTFFYYIGGGYQDFPGLGIERIVRYMKLFNLGEKTGVDLPNESEGFVPSKEWKEKVKGEKWYIGDTYHLSIGQGDLLVTPLQVAQWTAFFANRGKIVRPHLVKYILNKDNRLISAVDNKPLKEGIIDDYNIEVVRQGLRKTVTSGSAKRLQDLPVDSAAKTGTAQWNTTKDPHAWFTAFAPYKDPEIVVTVLVEEGKEGSQVGLTVAKDIMKYYFTTDISNHPVNNP